jgi:hypothetical protein
MKNRRAPSKRTEKPEHELLVLAREQVVEELSRRFPAPATIQLRVSCSEGHDFSLAAFSTTFSRVRRSRVFNPVPPNDKRKKNTHASCWHIDLDHDIRSL